MAMSAYSTDLDPTGRKNPRRPRCRDAEIRDPFLSRVRVAPESTGLDFGFALGASE